MSKEKLTVLYKISSDETVSQYSNALIFSIATAKEVVLLDILAVLPSDVGYSYSFWARRCSSTDSYFLLKAPTSIVPVIGSVVYLYLEASGNSPYVPLAQTFVFTENSRSLLYSRESYSSASKQASIQSSTDSQRNNRFRSMGQQRIQMNSAHQQEGGVADRPSAQSQSYEETAFPMESDRNSNKKTQPPSHNQNFTYSHSKHDRTPYRDNVSGTDINEYDYTYSQNQDRQRERERDNDRLPSTKGGGRGNRGGSNNSHADDLDLIAAQAIQVGL